MVLGYNNFFGLDDAQYAEKLKGYETYKLQVQERMRLRAQVAAAWSVLSGAGFAYFTMGGSLIVSGIGGRKWRVAHRKLELIRAELRRRGVQLHKMDAKDWLIPLVSCAAGTTLGLGVTVGVESIIDVSALASVGSHNGAAMLEHPSTAIEGFGEGLVAQPDLVAHGGQSDFLNGMLDTQIQLLGQGDDLHAQDVFQEFPLDSSVLNEQLAEYGGAYMGVKAATAVERALASILTQELSWWVMEMIEDRDVRQRVKQKGECMRLLGTPALSCRVCEELIFFGNYWHCCSSKCGNDNFELCQDCYGVGHRCKCGQLSLTERQFAWIGSLHYPNKEGLLRRCQEREFTKCEFCPTEIRQGRYFRGHPYERGREIDVCPWCYLSRDKLRYLERYELYSFVWASVLPDHEENPYEAFSGKVACCCERCGQDVKKGIFYHCKICKGTKGDRSLRGGNFDLCHVCYETSGGCNNEEQHILYRYEAFESQLIADQRDRFTTNCSIPACRKELSNEYWWYQCSECKVGGTVSTVCRQCYTSGVAHCRDRTHAMTRCRWPDDTEQVVTKRHSKFSLRWP